MFTRDSRGTASRAGTWPDETAGLLRLIVGGAACFVLVAVTALMH